MHLRAPSTPQGVSALAWAIFFGVFIWIGGIAVGYKGGFTFILGAVSGFLIFVFVRAYGDDEPRRS
jgi:hypothetical protein